MLALIEAVTGILPTPLRRRIPQAWLGLLAQLMQFGVVGVAGFVVDTAVVYATREPVGLYVAGTVAYVAAVTTTWWLNRIWTFRGLSNTSPAARQWARFFLANLPGLCLNLGSYFALVATVPVCTANPVIAIAVGAVSGMTANFLLSRALVFR